MSTTTRPIVFLALAAASFAAASARADIQPESTPALTRQAIQAAIDAAAPTGGTVTLGDGLFEIDSQLMVTNGVTLEGQGWERTTIKQTAAPGANTRVMTIDGGSTVSQVTLTGGRTAATWANGSGAGAYVKDGTISWCRITGNATGAGSATANNLYGCAVSFYEGKGRIDHSIIDSNEGGSKSGYCHGGGIGINNPSGTITVDASLVFGNSATGDGGGIYASFGNFHNLLTIRNTTIAGNEASGTGGGVYATEYYAANKFSFAIVNSILADNVSGSEGADANLALPSDDRIVSGYAAQSCNNLFANGTTALGADSTSIAGSGSAWFVGAADGDYHLRPASPADGAGTTYTGMDVDLDNVHFADPPAIGCYELSERAAAPVFDPASGSTFYPSTNVTLTCGTTDARIYYTLDGSTPTDSSTAYTVPLAIAATTTIKARAYATGLGPSAVATATYTLKRPTPKPADFKKSVEITLATNLASTAVTTGIPALVKLGESTISGFDYDDFSLANGGDMMFVDANGDPLPHEIDAWDATGESLVWVKLPSTAAGTKIVLYYGKGAVSSEEATDVWANYVGVWHLNEASGSAQDATGHGLTAVPSGANNAADSVGVACQVGNGRQMATAKGNKSYLAVANSDLLDCGDSLTFSGWFKAKDAYSAYSMRYVSRKNAYTGVDGWEFEAKYDNNANNSATQVAARGGSSDSYIATVPDIRNNWLHLAVVFNGKKLTYYVNGVQQTTQNISAAASDNDLALTFGNNPLGTESNWVGWMDELRLMADPASADYAIAEYAAMNTSATDIFAYGEAQDAGQGGTGKGLGISGE